MKNYEIATRHFVALAMTRLFVILAIICLFSTPSFAEFYRYNIDELARKAKVRIKEIEQRIIEEKAVKELKDLLAEIVLLYEEAESLYVERKYEEAITVYRKIDRMSQSARVRKWFEDGKVSK